MDEAMMSSPAARAFELFLAGMARSNISDMLLHLAPDARIRLNGFNATVEDLLGFMAKWSEAAPGGKRRLGFLEHVEIGEVENIDARTSRVRGSVEFDHDGHVDLAELGPVEATGLAAVMPLIAVVTVNGKSLISSLDIDLNPEAAMAALLFDK